MSGLVRVEPLGEALAGEPLEQRDVGGELGNELGALLGGQRLTWALLTLQVAGEEAVDARPPSLR